MRNNRCEAKKSHLVLVSECIIPKLIRLQLQKHFLVWASLLKEDSLSMSEVLEMNLEKVQMYNMLFKRKLCFLSCMEAVGAVHSITFCR